MNHKFLIMMITVSLCIFSIFAIATSVNDELVMDQVVISWLHNITSPIFVQMMDLITKLGSSEMILLITIVIAGFMFYKKAVLHSLFVLFITASGVGVNYVLKVLFQRERPEDTQYIDAFGYQFKLISYSFPSGHMMRITLISAVVIYLCYVYVKKSSLRMTSYIVCGLLVAVVGLSRIVLGEHFPSDIIAAIFASIVWFGISLYMLSYVKSKRRFRFSK